LIIGFWLQALSQCNPLIPKLKSWNPPKIPFAWIFLPKQINFEYPKLPFPTNPSMMPYLDKPFFVPYGFSSFRPKLHYSSCFLVLQFLDLLTQNTLKKEMSQQDLSFILAMGTFLNNPNNKLMYNIYSKNFFDWQF
jgi:hypothetical protein